VSELKAVLFDLDGTLIDSEIDFRKMKRRSIRLLEDSGVDKGLLTEELLNYDIEKRAVENLRKKGYSEVQIQRVFRKVADIMNEIELEAIEDAKLLEGVVDTLVKLRELGLKIGIITRGCRQYANKILEKFELERLIDAVAARDDVLKPKPDPEHSRYLMEILGVKSSETVMIGDGPMDALCARNVGMRFFLVPKRNTNLMAFKEYSYETLRKMKDIVYILQMKGSSAM
jgi:HAD superfamily hydrolase (TIGR01549 family)